jgi:hypothetical protein
MTPASDRPPLFLSQKVYNYVQSQRSLLAIAP